MSLSDPQDVRVAPEGAEEDSAHPLRAFAVEMDESARIALEAWLDGQLSLIESAMAPLRARWQQERDQLAGRMPGGDYPYEGAFRVNYPLTRKKVREIANRIKQAYLETDPVWGIDLDDPTLFQLAIAVEKALDVAVDHELNEEDDLALALHDAVAHGTGLLVPGWVYHEESVTRLERWAGYDGVHLETMADLHRLEQTYPDWRETPALVRLHAQLRRGQDVAREIRARRVVVNHPDFQHVELDAARVHPSVTGYEGLRTTPCYGFETTFTHFQLEGLDRDGTIDEGALARLLGERPGERSQDDDPQRQAEPVRVFQGTIRYARPGDAVPMRYKVWFAPVERVLLRLRAYPWWYHEADLIPLSIRAETPGFFKEGVAADLLDEHTCLNVLLNLYLNAIDLANSMQWKAKYRSIGYAHVLSRRWSPHLPAPWKDSPNEIESMAKSVNHLGPIVTGFELLRRQSDEATGTSTLQSGRESPTDPSAPATKTLALLQQVQPNERDMLRSLEPGFRQLGIWTLWLYFQAKELGWIDRLPGGLQVPTDLLPVLAEHLHPRAALYEFDRQGRFQRNVSVIELTSKLLGASRPDVLLKMLRVAISQTDSQWARLVDTLDLERPGPIAAPGPGASPSVGGNGRSASPSGHGAPTDRLAALVGPG